jgi:integrase
MASIYKRGATYTAHVQYRTADGERAQRKIGGFRTRKEAVAAANQIENNAIHGIAVAPDRLTVAGHLHEWIDHREAMGSLKRSTVQSYRTKIDSYIVPALGHIGLQRLTALDLDRLYRYVHSIVHKALHDAERSGLVEHNVARRSNPPASKAAKAPKFAVWSDGELAAFLGHVDALPHGLAFRFAAFTGVRRGEVCGLRWADLDLAGGTAMIRHAIVEVAGGGIHEETPKNHRERAVALDADLVARLRHHHVEQNKWRLVVGGGWRDHDAVFCGPGGDYVRPDVLSNRFRAYVAASGLPTIRLHDLRHGHATGLVASGIDAASVSARLGHATVQFTLDVYVKPSSARQANAAQAFADRIAAVRLPSPTKCLPSAVGQV